jgi:hypothetical protein
MNNRTETSPAVPASSPATHRTRGDTHQPDDAEIFAASPLVIVEDRQAYKRLFLETWARILPRDGFEKEMLRQMVNYCWQVRRLIRLEGYRLRKPTGEALAKELAQSEDAIARWKDNAGPTAIYLVMDFVMKGLAPDLNDITEMLANEDKRLDIGVLIALDAALKDHGDLQDLVNKYLDYADQCLRRIMKHRERQARLRRLEADDQ